MMYGFSTQERTNGKNILNLLIKFTLFWELKLKEKKFKQYILTG
jgi:hypothetical protein